MRRRARAANWATHGLAVTSGVAIGLVLQHGGGFKVSKKIDLVSLSTLVVSIGISVVFYRKFARHQYSDQLKKDALIRRLRLCFENACAVQRASELKPLRFADVLGTLKVCGRDFRGCAAFAQTIGLPISRGTVKEHTLACRDINWLLTWTPPSQGTGDPVKIQDGEIVLSNDRRVEVELRIEDLKQILHTVEAEVICAV